METQTHTRRAQRDAASLDAAPTTQRLRLTELRDTNGTDDLNVMLERDAPRNNHTINKIRKLLQLNSAAETRAAGRSVRDEKDDDFKN